MTRSPTTEPHIPVQTTQGGALTIQLSQLGDRHV